MTKPTDREWYAQELARVLDEIDARREALRDEVKERKGAIAKLEKRARELRAVVSGRRGAQLEISPAAGALAEARARKEETKS